MRDVGGRDEALAALVAPHVTVAQRTGDAPAELFEAERAVIARAIAPRRAEFAAVRACAREALARLGREPAAILPGPGGEPRWPEGIVGSLTHCPGYRAAALAEASRVRAVGIDAEPREPLPAQVHELVATPGEWAGLALLPSTPRVPWDRVLFSAKESVYKAWYPLTGRFLEYEHLHIDVRPDGSFSARILVPGVSVDGRLVEGFDGRWGCTQALVLTAVTLAAR